MIGYLIKNNFKIMFRNGINLVIYIIGPVIISAVLSSAFSALFESYEGISDFKAGYSIEEDSDLYPYIDILKDIGEENGVLFTEYEPGTAEESIQDHDLGGFVEFGKDSYKVYKTGDAENEGMILSYFMSTFFNTVISGDTEDIQIHVEHPDYAPSIDSTDYYGIIYIVYFGWLAIICAAGLLSNERKHNIPERLQVSDLSCFQIYMSRLVPLVCSVGLSLGIAAVFNSLLLGVHWGNILLSSVIVLALIIAASSFGLMLYELTSSTVAAIFIAFALIWTMGFIGGTFESYILSSMPEGLKHLMPIYHSNRALVELSSMGKSDFVKSAIMIPVAITAVCSAFSVGTAELKRRVR
ncbi:MAG: ABC transporter permease [Lachnospiraceae bacterium]|nr:ABC transporter permease [Lachnospiraceae bacterium]